MRETPTKKANQMKFPKFKFSLSSMLLGAVLAAVISQMIWNSRIEPMVRASIEKKLENTFRSEMRILENADVLRTKIKVNEQRIDFARNDIRELKSALALQPRELPPLDYVGSREQLRTGFPVVPEMNLLDVLDAATADELNRIKEQLQAELP